MALTIVFRGLARVNRYRIPFLTTQMGKGVVDEGSELYVGTAALSSDDFVHRAVARADVILNVGHNVVEKPPFLIEDNGVKVIHVDFGSAQVDPVYFPQVEVVGDIAHSFDALMERLEPQESWDFSHIPAIREAAATHFRKRAASDDFPIRSERLVYDVRRVLRPKSILTLDNGM